MVTRKFENFKIPGSVPMAAVDARSVIPVSDEIGGVVVYMGDRPAYYVLNGELFSAVSERQVQEPSSQLLQQGHLRDCLLSDS